MKNINLANLIAQFNLVHDKIKHSFNSVISVISFKLDLFLVKFNFFTEAYSSRVYFNKNLTHFYFVNFYKVHLNIDPIFLQWFIGFSEGDGSILNRDSGRLTFILTQKESSILYHVQEVLGFGRITLDQDSNCYRFIVEDLASIYKLAHLFNGNIILENRIDQLTKWISVLESKGYPISANLTPVSITLFDGWLSGFTDAEGCFTGC